MKRTLLNHFLIVMAVIFIASLFACKKDNKETDAGVSAHDLFASKCTTCHGEDEAYKLHGTEETILKVVQRMTKKGAKLSQVEAMNIAGYLSSPTRSLFETKCSKCHALNDVLKAHKENALTQATLKDMQKKGADISPKEEEKILEFLNKFFIPEESRHQK